MPQGSSIQEVADHFKATSWGAKLLAAPDVVYSVPMCRRDRDGRGPVESQDQLLRTSLNNDDAVPYIILLHRDPESPAAPWAAMSKQTDEPSTSSSSSGPTFSNRSASLLVDLKPGVVGFSGATHGGFLATIMDEAMGSLIFVNYEYQRAQEEKAHRTGPDHRWQPPPGVLDMNAGFRVLTATMNVRFLKPLVIPKTVLVTATLSRIVGRKIYLDVTVQDEMGAEYAQCEGMWIMIPPEKRPRL